MSQRMTKRFVDVVADANESMIVGIVADSVRDLRTLIGKTMPAREPHRLLDAILGDAIDRIEAEVENPLRTPHEVGNDAMRLDAELQERLAGVEAIERAAARALEDVRA